MGLHLNPDLLWIGVYKISVMAEIMMIDFDKVDRLKANYEIINGKAPLYFNVHPNDIFKIMQTYPLNMESYTGNNLIIFGLKVLRSFDVDEGKSFFSA